MSEDEETKESEEHTDGPLPDALDDAFEDDAAIPEDDLGAIDSVAEEDEDADVTFYGDERDANY